MQKNTLFWLFTFTVFLGIFLPHAMKNGMFLDGLVYGSISNNLANGIGTFWNPHYTQTHDPIFHAHPPLVFGIQSLFFHVFGQGLYVERIYTLLTTVLSATGMVLLWRLLVTNKEIKSFAWISILLWATIPLNFWAFQNNLLDNTLVVFTIFSVYFITKSLKEEKITWMLLGSVFLVLAFFSKGFVGLFPLATPAIFLLVYRPKPFRHKLFLVFLFMLLTPILFYCSIYYLPGAKENLMAYLSIQVFPAVNNELDVTTSSHFSIFLNLFIEIAAPIAILLFIFLFKRVKKQTTDANTMHTSLYVLGIALSASLPLIITLKQRNYYLLPSLPFYLLAIGIFIAPFVNEKTDALPNGFTTWFKRITIAGMLGVTFFTIYSVGGYSRDEEKIKDAYTLSDHIPKGTIISTTPDIAIDWSFRAYVSRIGFLSIDSTATSHPYYLIEKNNTQIQLGEQYDTLPIHLTQYTLFKNTSYKHKKREAH